MPKAESPSEGEFPWPSRRIVLITFGPVIRPEGGLGVRAKHVMQDLLANGNEVVVLSVGETTRPEWRKVFSRFHNGEVISLGDGNPAKWIPRLAVALLAIRPRVDVIVGESALLLAPISFISRAVFIWDTNGCETAHYASMPKSPSMRIKGLIWRLLEFLVGARSRIILPINEPEAIRWKKYFPHLGDKLMTVHHLPPITVKPITNGYSYGGEDPTITNDHRYILFLGSNAKHNVEASEWCIRELAPKLPTGVILVLAGRGSDDLVKSMGSPPSVRGLGFVDDVDTLVAGAEICLDPLRTAAGVEIKLLHYVVHHKLIVCTPLALEGIEDVPGCISIERTQIPKIVVEILINPESSAERNSREESQESWIADYSDASQSRRQWQEVLNRAFTGQS